MSIAISHYSRYFFSSNNNYIIIFFSSTVCRDTRSIFAFGYKSSQIVSSEWASASRASSLVNKDQSSGGEPRTTRPQTGRDGTDNSFRVLRVIVESYSGKKRQRTLYAEAERFVVVHGINLEDLERRTWERERWTFRGRTTTSCSSREAILLPWPFNHHLSPIRTQGRGWRTVTHGEVHLHSSVRCCSSRLQHFYIVYREHV